MRRILRLIMVMVLVGGWSQAMAGPRTVTLMLDWFPNVDHLPIYVAQQRGFLESEGLQLKILSPSDTTDALKLAVSGKVDLAVSYEPQTIIAAAQGLNVVAVGRLVEHPLTTLLYLHSKGFRHPRDLEGKRIGYTVPGLMDVLLTAFARKEITLSRIQIGPQIYWHITPVPELLRRVLAFLGLSVSLYTRLVENST